MKKTLLIIILTIVALSGLYAEADDSLGLSLQANIGGSYTLADMKENTSSLGLPVGLTALYRLVTFGDESLADNLTLEAGLSASYLRLYNESYSDATRDYNYDFNLTTLPVSAVIRATAGGFFAGAGAGVHFWNDYGSIVTGSGDAVNHNNNNLGFCFLAEAGYAHPVTEIIYLTGSLNYYNFNYTADSHFYSTSTMSVTAGISCRF